MLLLLVIRSYKSCLCRPLCLRCCWWFQVLFLLLFFVFVNGLSNRALIVLPLLQHFVHLMRSIVDAAQFLLPSLDCHMQFHKLYMHIYTNIFIPITTPKCTLIVDWVMVFKVSISIISPRCSNTVANSLVKEFKVRQGCQF